MMGWENATILFLYREFDYMVNNISSDLMIPEMIDNAIPKQH